MALKSQNNILAGTSLARAQIQSPNYVPGVSGWAIFQNGNAEFNEVTIRNGVVVSGIELYYDGTPAAGNLIFSVAAVASTDEFGNHYLGGGAAWYSATSAVAIQSGATITYYIGSLSAGWAPTAAEINFASATQIDITGAIIATSGTAANPSIISTDIWTVMALANGWASSGDVDAAYRLVASPQRSVEIIGRINATTATSTTFFTLPAGPPNYVPLSVQDFAAEASGGVPAGTSCGINCDTSGNLSVNHGTIGANNNYGFHGFIALDI